MSLSLILQRGNLQDGQLSSGGRAFNLKAGPITSSSNSRTSVLRKCTLDVARSNVVLGGDRHVAIAVAAEGQLRPCTVEGEFGDGPGTTCSFPRSADAANHVAKLLIASLLSDTVTARLVGGEEEPSFTSKGRPSEGRLTEMVFNPWIPAPPQCPVLVRCADGPEGQPRVCVGVGGGRGGGTRGAEIWLSKPSTHCCHLGVLPLLSGHICFLPPTNIGNGNLCNP